MMKIAFCIRSVQRQPPMNIAPAARITREPSAICQPLPVEMSLAQLMYVVSWPISPTALRPGTTPVVTNAMPKNATERNWASSMKTDEMTPRVGWMTRLTIV